MKFFITLISFLFTFSFCDNLYVKSERYSDQNVHLGLPSWVKLTNPHIEKIDESFENQLTKTIVLPESHKISYLGKDYSLSRYLEMEILNSEVKRIIRTHKYNLRGVQVLINFLGN